MLLYFLITCFSFIFLFKSLPLKPLPPLASEMRLLSLCFWKQVSIFSIFNFIKKTLCRLYIPSTKRMGSCPQVEATNEDSGMTVLDLPELTLECILERLPPSGLCSMAGVCRSLRERCVSNHLWEKHMKQKWGGLMGPAAHREWQWYLARRDSANLRPDRQRGLMRLLSIFWPFWWVRSTVVNGTNYSKQRSDVPVDSIMSWYLSLENGEFWFPAQVYNRENGHVGFMLSCYDAELSYDPRTDTFQARYPPHGRRAIAIETNVPWERLRAPPVDTSPHDLHISNCLNELRPGDHIEIQWRRNKEFPYGWWYGVVGHLESCDGNETYCRCHNNDMVALEFNHYTPGSRWRQTTISRKEHREEGNEADGFYGGIRKLKSNEEISIWKRLWPVRGLE